jgi:hypothetical protein
MPNSVPREFAEQDIRRLQPAADQLADTIRFHAIKITDDRAKAAEREAHDIFIGRFVENDVELMSFAGQGCGKR